MPFNQNDATQRAALAAEINTDPNAYGLVALRDAGNYQGIADALNLSRAAITIRRPDVMAHELLEVIDTRDLGPQNGGTANESTLLQAAWLTGLLTQTRIRLANADGTVTRTRQNLNRLIRDANGSQARFDALAIRQGSRAEVLFGAGTVLSHGDVSAALAS